jgi:hypothetical protein
MTARGQNAHCDGITIKQLKVLSYFLRWVLAVHVISSVSPARNCMLSILIPELQA